jgi:hypothetical protein
MAYTHHGHEIPGSPNFGPIPTWRVFCGGPDECTQCRLDVASFEIGKYLPKENPLEIFAMIPLMQAIINAWNDPGRSPSHHEAMQRQLLVDWPVLGRAVKTLAEQSSTRKQVV